MPAVSDDAAITPAVSILDPNLPFLASRAAIELDNLLLGKAAELGAVKQLATRLREATAIPAGAAEYKTLMDPPTVSAINDALSIVRSTPMKSVEELVAESSRVASDLQCTSVDQSRQMIERSRLFCVTLSQLATSYQQSVYDSDPILMQGR